MKSSAEVAADAGRGFRIDIQLTIYMTSRILRGMPISATDLFSALAHDTRLRCLMLLLRHRELCVRELTEAIGAAQPHMSRHLARLRELGLVTDRREGLWIHYRINPDVPDWIGGLLQATSEGLELQPPFGADAAAPTRISDRQSAQRCAPEGG